MPSDNGADAPPQRRLAHRTSWAVAVPGTVLYHMGKESFNHRATPRRGVDGRTTRIPYRWPIADLGIT
jgi:hypothetical protein